MATPHVPGNNRRLALTTVLLSIGALVGVSAHVIRSAANPMTVTAFVSSPTSGVDAPIPVAWGSLDTGLRVACFYAANTSQPRSDDAAWPRVTAVGFELPGQPTGFTLLSPLGGDWALVEGVQVDMPQQGPVTLDVALVAPVNPMGRSVAGDPGWLLGIPPGQSATRLSGTRFCVSGPFPDGFSIEQILNGVVVRFHGVDPYGPSIDIGVWDNPARTIPLFR